MNTKHWVIEGVNNWEQLLGTWNWYTWTLIHIEFEKENLAYGYEFMFVLLGFGFRIRYNTDKSLEQFDEWEEDVMEAKDDLKIFDKDDLIEHYSETWTDLKDK